MKNEKQTPALRFRGFDGPWEKKTFSAMAERVSIFTDDSTLPRVEYEDIISGQGRLNKDVYKKNSTKSGIRFSKGQILFGKLRPYLKNWMYASFEGIAVGDFWVLQPTSADGLFLYYLIQSVAFQSVTNQTTGTKMPRADWKIVSKAEFVVPASQEEQHKIGIVLRDFDEKIFAQEQKIKKAEQFRRAMLSKLFPAEGASEPALRFRGFSGPWVKRGLLENFIKIIDFRGRTPKKLGMNWSESGYPALSALNVKDGYIDFSQDIHFGSPELYEKWMTGNELHCGQVIFTTEAPMGNVAQIPDDRKYILSQRTIAFEVNPSLLTEDFLAILLRSPKVQKDLQALSSGGTAKGVSQRSMEMVDVILPSKLEEQKKIGDFFYQLDSYISLQREKREKLRRLKAALLEKLFV